MPRGTAARGTTRYRVQLTVPRRGGWRAWGAVRADFERARADAADPAIAPAEIASELRWGADYVRVTRNDDVLVITQCNRRSICRRVRSRRSAWHRQSLRPSAEAHRTR